MTSYRAIEERYATWQARLALSKYCQSVIDVAPGTRANEVAGRIKTPFTLVVTGTLIVPPTSAGVEALLRAAEAPGVFATVPVANDTTAAVQHRPSEQIYLTLRQFEDTAARYLTSAEAPVVAEWQTADPGMFLVKTESLLNLDTPIEKLLNHRQVSVVPQAYFHRFAEHRSQVRLDLLELIDTTATSILEFGCGEGALGQALKERQQCRVEGIELDPDAAAIARTRLDAVHNGDVRDLIPGMIEKFDWIVGGDILEHIEEPWTFLRELRKASKPGGKLLLSLPNVSSWPIVADLLRGRFDYVYMGILCAGHVRFFTKETVRDMLAISGWADAQLTDQPHFQTPEYDQLVAALEKGGIPHSPADLLPTGHYVIAVNQG